MSGEVTIALKNSVLIEESELKLLESDLELKKSEKLIIEGHQKCLKSLNEFGYSDSYKMMNRFISNAQIINNEARENYDKMESIGCRSSSKIETQNEESIRDTIDDGWTSTISGHAQSDKFKQREIKTLKKGQMFGAMNLINGTCFQNKIYSVRVKEDCHLAIFGK